MRDYKGIASYVSDLIKKEKDSININSTFLASIINTSIDAYYDMNDLKLSTVEEWNSLFTMLEAYAQNMVNIVDGYIDSKSYSDSFLPFLNSLRKLHADMLASLIIMRTDLNNTSQFSE